MDDNEKLNIFDQFFKDFLTEGLVLTESGSRRKKTSRTVMVSYDDDTDYKLKNGILSDGDNMFKTLSILDFLSSDNFIEYLKNIITTYYSEHLFLKLLSGNYYPDEDINIGSIYSKVDPYQKINFGGSQPGLVPIETLFGKIELNIPSILLFSFLGTKSLIHDKNIKLDTTDMNLLSSIGQKIFDSENHPTVNNHINFEQWKNHIKLITDGKLDNIIKFFKTDLWHHELENIKRSISIRKAFGTVDLEEFNNGVGLFCIYDITNTFEDEDENGIDTPYALAERKYVTNENTGREKEIFTSRFRFITRDRQERDEIIRSILDENGMWVETTETKSKKFTSFKDIEFETRNINVEKLFNWLVNDCGITRNKLLECPGFSVAMNAEVGVGISDDAIANRTMLNNITFEHLDTPVIANRKIRQEIKDNKTFSEILFGSNPNIPKIDLKDNLYSQYIKSRVITYMNLQTAFSRVPLSLADFYSTLHSTLSFIKELTHINEQERDKLEANLSKGQNLTDANTIAYKELKDAVNSLVNLLKNTSPTMTDAIQFAEFIDPLTDKENKSLRVVYDYENNKPIPVSLVSDDIDDIIDRNRFLATMRLFDGELVDSDNTKRETRKGSTTRMVLQLLNDYIKISGGGQNFENESKHAKDQIRLVLSGAKEYGKKPKISVRYKVTEEAIDEFLKKHERNIDKNESMTSDRIGDYINDNLNSSNLEISYILAEKDAGAGRESTLDDNMSISITEYKNKDLGKIKARSIKINVPTYPDDILSIYKIGNKSSVPEKAKNKEGMWNPNLDSQLTKIENETIEKINSEKGLKINENSVLESIKPIDVFQYIVESTVDLIVSFMYVNNRKVREDNINSFIKLISSHFIPDGELLDRIENTDKETIFSDFFETVAIPVVDALKNLQLYIRLAWTYYNQINSDLGYFSKDAKANPKNIDNTTSIEEIKKYLNTRCNMLRRNQAAVQARSTSRAKLAAYNSGNEYSKTEGFGVEINNLVLGVLKTNNAFRTFEKNYNYIIGDRTPTALYNFYKESVYPSVVSAMYEMFEQPISDEFECGVAYHTDLNHIGIIFGDLIEKRPFDPKFDKSFNIFVALFNNELNNGGLSDDEKMALKNVTTGFFDQCYLFFLILLACGGEMNKEAGIPMRINTPGVGKIDNKEETEEENPVNYSFNITNPQDKAAYSSDWEEF